MAAGKTTLGSALAARICCRFIDLDKEIEKQSQCSISELFARAGEPAFRKIEQQVLFHIVNQLPSAKPDTQSTDVHNNQDTDVLHNQNTDVLPNNTIIACGGGTPCSEENLAFMKAHGFVIYLEVSPETLCERLLCTPVEARPLLSLRNPITSQNPATSQDPITFQDRRLSRPHHLSRPLHLSRPHHLSRPRRPPPTHPHPLRPTQTLL